MITLSGFLWTPAGLHAQTGTTSSGRSPAGERTPVSSDLVSSTSFPDREAQDPPLFRRVPPEESGIELTNTFSIDHERWYLFHSAFAGVGVAIGDYDGNGRPDVFLTGHVKDSRLYRQVEPFQFEEVTKKAGIRTKARWSGGASFADVNGDGHLDLYVCNYMQPNQLFINQGNGTFRERASTWNLDVKRASVMAQFSDYDRDGDLDMYLVTSREYRKPGQPTRDVEVVGSKENPRVIPEDRSHHRFLRAPGMEPQLRPSGQKDLLFRNDGSSFKKVTSAAGINEFDMGLAARWWDYNEDGWPDLYVANDFRWPDRLYRNNGDGTFTKVIRDVISRTPWSSMGLAAGDLNGDRRIDLMATDMDELTHRERILTGGSEVKRTESIKSAKEPESFWTSADPQQYNWNAVYLNNALNRFAEGAYLMNLARTDWTWSVKIRDFDGDGILDVYVTNGMTGNFVNTDYQREEQRVWELLRERFSGSASRSFVKMWDRQRRILQKHAPERRDVNLAFRGGDDISFTPTGSAWGLEREAISFGAAVSDLDRDGDLDLIVNSLNDPVSVYENTSANDHRLLLRLRGRESNTYGIGAHLSLVTPDERQVRDLQPVEGYMASDEPLVHFGLGEEEEIEKLIIRWPSGIRQVVTELTPDRFYTITEPERAAGEVSKSTPAHRREKKKETLFSPAELPFTHREETYNDMKHQPLLPWKHSRLGPGLAWGDADEDGDPDLFVGGAAGQSGRLLINRDGTLKARKQKGPWNEDADHEDMAVLWVDVNGDGARDLFVASGSSEFEQGAPEQADRIYLNNGEGTFERAPEEMWPQQRGYSGPAAAVDYDRDGDLDLFVGGRMVPGTYPDAPRSRLLENRDGRFLDVTDEVAPELRRVGMVTSALWSDVNGDGWMDLLLARAWGPITYFENTGEGRLEEKTEEVGLGETNGLWNGLWNGITGTDVNGDGRMDYVVTNLGRNTRYHASTDRPYLLYAGDMDDDGERELVEALYEEKTLYPVRGRKGLTAAVSFIEEKYEDTASYAGETLVDVFSKEQLRDADKRSVTRLNSVVLINQKGSTFDVRPLPYQAQLAPGFSAVSSSFGRVPGPGVFLAQNFFSTQSGTGRMNGGIGLLMRPDVSEASGFSPYAPGRSGIALTGDMMAAAAADVNGDARPDLAVSRNDTSVVLMTHQDMGVGRLMIRYAGENTGLIPGSRIAVFHGDERLAMREMHAGHGYLSQSERKTFVRVPDRIERVTLKVRWVDGSTKERVVKNPTGKTITLRRR